MFRVQCVADTKYLDVVIFPAKLAWNVEVSPVDEEARNAALQVSVKVGIINDQGIDLLKVQFVYLVTVLEST